MANRIRQLRKEVHMTQVRLSIELEVTQETVSAYETGKHQPSIKALLKMSELFHAGTDYILGLSDVRIPDPADSLSSEESRLLSMYRNLNSAQKALACSYIQGLFDTGSANS